MIPLPTGQMLGQYRIDAMLGAGAMGVVYRAYDTRLHRTVAIKRLQDASSAAADLLEEARAASTLNHPNICTVYEVGEADGQAYIAMEYVDGSPLAGLIPASGLSRDTVLDYGRQIADALAFAHEAGVVHRDLKSSNIVVSKAGRAIVLDFGLARRVPNRSTPDATAQSTVATTTGNVAGTPAYMAPEVLRGEVADTRSDVWSLGVVLHEMASGRRPYAGSTAFALASGVLSDAPVVLPDSVDPALGAVVKRCLAKAPARRYRQGGEVRAALETLQTSPSGGTTAVPRPSPWTRRRLATLGLVAASLALVLTARPLRALLGRVLDEPVIAFAERDWLVVSDVDNETGDPLFDRALNTALSVALTQSRYVNIVPQTRIRQTLRRMGRENLGRVDEAAAREIALREGFRLVLTPVITSVGGGYLLAASLVDPASGATLKGETVQAVRRDGVLAAIDELTRRVRGDLGEATAMIAGQARPLAAVTTSSLEALQRFSLARDAHLGQQLERARLLYEEALRLDPTFIAARATLGMLNIEFFDRAAGLKLLSQAIAEVDGLTESERVSVQAFHAVAVEGNLNRAADLWRAFLAVRPDTATAHNNLGRVYLAQRRFDAAIAEFNETLRLDPDLLLTYFSLNVIYLFELGDLDAAIATARRQLTRDDRSARAHGQLGIAYAGKNDLRQAEAALRTAIELDGRVAFDWQYLGHVLRRQGRLDEARDAYRRAVEIDPRTPSLRYDAGAASQLLGDSPAAAQYFRDVGADAERRMRQDPTNTGARFELAAAQARLGRRSRAESLLGTPEGLTPDQQAERAGVLALLGRIDEALRTLGGALEHGYRNVVRLRTSSDLHALQSDARFEAILATITSRGRAR